MSLFFSTFLSIKQKYDNKGKKGTVYLSPPFPSIFYVLPLFSMHLSIQKKRENPIETQTNKRLKCVALSPSPTLPMYFLVFLLLSILFHTLSIQKRKKSKNLLHPLPHLLSFFFTLSFSHTFCLH
jgi:hypothetical protein